MLRRRLENNRTAQVFLEYTLVIGAIVLIIFAMNTMIKRGAQGMIKVVADQIGNQEASDQRFDNDSGFLESSYVSTRSETDKTKKEFLRVTTYIYDDEVTSNSTAVINLGFTNEN